MRDIGLAIRFASNTFQRLMLAVASTLYALTTALGPDLQYARGPQVYQALVLSSGEKWIFAAIFGLDAFCLWWRLIDKTPRVFWAFFTNAFTAILWVTITSSTIATYRAFLPDSAAETTICVVSLFSLIRTNKTHNDVETA